MPGDKILEMAHVLFMDVVSYSLLPIDRQTEIMAELQDIVRASSDYQQSLKAGQVVSLPTGDGMALALFGDPLTPVRCAQQISIALKTRLHLQLRMGIHTGPVYSVADINANRNVAGGGINLAQRVMDCGDAGHILVSSAVADTLAQLSDWRETIEDLGDVTVKHGVVIHIYNLRSPEFGNPAIPAKVAAARPVMHRGGSEPNLGRLVAKMCDRRAQEDDFHLAFLDALQQRPGCPQLYFVLGEEGQCHESLVERLIHRACLSTGDDADGVTAGRIRRIPWHYEGELSQRATRLIYSLFDSLAPRSSWREAKHKDVSPSSFSALVRNSLSAWIAIQHDVHASRWDSKSAELLSEYLKFWHDLPPLSERAPVLVFVNIVFPAAENSGWTKFVPVLSRIRKKRFWDLLKRVESTAGIPCRVLAELPAVSRSDIIEWFSLNNIHDSEERRMRAANRLFPPGDNRSRAMWEIETFCAEELETCARERGYTGSFSTRRSFEILAARPT